MGRHKRRKREEALEERLKELESRLDEWSRHDRIDGYINRPSRSRSTQSRSTRARFSSRTRSRSPIRSRSRTRSRSRSPRSSKRGTSHPRSTPSPTTGNLGATVAISAVESVPTQANNIPSHYLELLGHEGALPTKNSIELHESLATRWTAILSNGLESDMRTQLIKKYDPPSNVPHLVPPKLNEEVAAAMNENNIKRDKRIAQNQATLAASITRVGGVLNNMITSHGDEAHNAHIQTLSDATRLLCDLYHENSITRRSLILPGLNKDMKDLMEQTPISEYLFGDKLQERVKTIKAVKKSGQELKNTPPAKVSAKPKPPNYQPLNYRRPQRPVPRPSGQKPKQRRATQATKSSTRSRHSPQRHHHPQRRGHRKKRYK